MKKSASPSAMPWFGWLTQFYSNPEESRKVNQRQPPKANWNTLSKK